MTSNHLAVRITRRHCRLVSDGKTSKWKINALAYSTCKKIDEEQQKIYMNSCIQAKALETEVKD